MQSESVGSKTVGNFNDSQTLHELDTRHIKLCLLMHAGFTGLAGFTGDTGFSGYTGFTGATGDTGFTGATGAK